MNPTSSEDSSMNLTEAQWQTQVVGIARQYGFECFHPPANRPDANGRKQTATAGWPDLVILGKGRALFVELKSETGRIRPEQITTLRRLAEAGCETAVWRPRDLPAVLAALGPVAAERRGVSGRSERATTTPASKAATTLPPRAVSPVADPCPSVYPPSADAPHDGGGWSGPVRCVLSVRHGDDGRADYCPVHWNTGIHWTDEAADASADEAKR